MRARRVALASAQSNLVVDPVVVTSAVVWDKKMLMDPVVVKSAVVWDNK